MAELTLDVRLDGFDNPVGQLKRTYSGALSFQYSVAHLKASNALPLSLSLPLTDAPVGDVEARAFFNNLLQERGDALSTVMARESISRADIAGLLFHLGKDCAGALSVLPVGAPPTKVPGDLGTDYVELSEARLGEIVTALHQRRRLPDGTQDPSPLAGVQSKIAMTLSPGRGFAEPKPGSGAPTTHILKVPDQNHASDAKTESTTLALSRLAGIEAAEAQVYSISGIDVLVVQRFDRALDSRGQITRVHQEDFAQALGLPAELKYERYGKAGRKFDALSIARVLDQTIEPATARRTFIEATVFDLLTGNCDAHAKNHAVFHLGNNRIKLTPRYDLVPTRLDPTLTDDLPFRIGRASKVLDITADDFGGFLLQLGIQSNAARLRISATACAFIANRLASSLEQLSAEGMKLYADLIAANMRQLCPVLGAPVPESARYRDAFVARPGGW